MKLSRLGPLAIFALTLLSRPTISHADGWQIDDVIETKIDERTEGRPGSDSMTRHGYDSNSGFVTAIAGPFPADGSAACAYTYSRRFRWDGIGPSSPLTVYVQTRIAGVKLEGSDVIGGNARASTTTPDVSGETFISNMPPEEASFEDFGFRMQNLEGEFDITISFSAFANVGINTFGNSYTANAYGSIMPPG